jgi:hypothetical protein
MSADLIKFNGTWKLEDSDTHNSDKYMQKLGISYLKRKIALKMDRTMHFITEASDQAKNTTDTVDSPNTPRKFKLTKKQSPNLKRKSSKPEQIYSKFTIKSQTALSNRDRNVILNVPYQTKTDDGRQVQSVFSFDKKKGILSRTDQWDDRVSEHTWELNEDGKLIIKVSLDGVTVRQVFRKI